MTATPIDFIASGRRAVFLLIEVCKNDLDAVEKIINDTEAALDDATRPTGSKHILGMRTALRQVRTAYTNTKGLLEMIGWDAAQVRETVTQDEKAAGEGGYLTPKRKFYHQAQRWALDVLAA